MKITHCNHCFQQFAVEGKELYCSNKCQRDAQKEQREAQRYWKVFAMLCYQYCGCRPTLVRRAEKMIAYFPNHDYFGELSGDTIVIRREWSASVQALAKETLSFDGYGYFLEVIS